MVFKRLVRAFFASGQKISSPWTPPFFARERNSRRPCVSAEPNRTFCFSLIGFFWGRANQKDVKQNVLRGRPPLCGGWRRVLQNQQFLLK